MNSTTMNPTAVSYSTADEALMTKTLGKEQKSSQNMSSLPFSTLLEATITKNETGVLRKPRTAVTRGKAKPSGSESGITQVRTGRGTPQNPDLAAKPNSLLSASAQKSRNDQIPQDPDKNIQDGQVDNLLSDIQSRVSMNHTQSSLSMSVHQNEEAPIIQGGKSDLSTESLIALFVDESSAVDTITRDRLTALMADGQTGLETNTTSISVNITAFEQAESEVLLNLAGDLVLHAEKSVQPASIDPAKEENLMALLKTDPSGQTIVHLTEESNLATPLSASAKDRPLELSNIDDKMNLIPRGMDLSKMASATDQTIQSILTENDTQQIALVGIDPSTEYSPLEKNESPKDAVFINRITETMNSDEKTTRETDIHSDIPQAIISDVHKKSKDLLLKEASPYTEVQKPISSFASTSIGPETAAKQALPKRTTQQKQTREAGTAERSESTFAATTGYDRETIGQKGTGVTKFTEAPSSAIPDRNLVRHREETGSRIRIAGPEQFPFRMEMASVNNRQTSVTSSETPMTLNTTSVVDRIVDMKQAMSNDFSRVRIVLDPPNLGSLNLEIVIRREKVEVVMTAENASVQQALQSRTDDIRTALQRQDLKIESFQVLLQDQGSTQQQAHGQAMFYERHEHPVPHENQDDESPTINVVPSSMGMEQANGRLSFFV